MDLRRGEIQPPPSQQRPAHSAAAGLVFTASAVQRPPYTGPPIGRVGVPPPRRPEDQTLPPMEQLVSPPRRSLEHRQLWEEKVIGTIPTRPVVRPQIPLPEFDDAIDDGSTVLCITIRSATEGASDARLSYIPEQNIKDFLSDFAKSAVTGAPSLWLVCWNQSTTAEFPFSGAAKTTLTESLEIPPQWLDADFHKAGVCGKRTAPSGRRGQSVYVYRRSSNWGTISLFLNHDAGTSQTRGYLLAGPNIDLTAVAQSIISSFVDLRHPLALPIVAAEITASDLMRRLMHVHFRLAKLEEMTGFGDWGSQPGNEREIDFSAAGSSKSKSSLGGHHDDHLPWQAVDRKVLADELGIQSSRLAYIQAAVECTIETNEFTLKEIAGSEGLSEDARRAEDSRTRRGKRSGKGQFGANEQSRAGEMPQNRDAAIVISNLTDRATLLASSLTHLRRFGGLDDRMQTLQNFLYNVMNQQDAQINIQLARDSKILAERTKRDSTAMLIVAFLTTIFLPGTFIASVFAMPLLEWDAPTIAEVLSGRFWVYLATTLPMTAVVLLLVVAFVIYQVRMAAQDDREIEKKLGGKSVE